MHLHLRGDAVPETLYGAFAAITDHAKLRCAEVRHDQSSGVVSLPITRFPLVERRKVLGNVHDLKSPIQATVTVRNVIKCQVEDNTTTAPVAEVQLLYGIRLEDKAVFACSAEEHRGRTCFAVTLEVTELDFEMADRPIVPLTG